MLYWGGGIHKRISRECSRKTWINNRIVFCYNFYFQRPIHVRDRLLEKLQIMTWAKWIGLYAHTWLSLHPVRNYCGYYWHYISWSFTPGPLNWQIIYLDCCIYYYLHSFGTDFVYIHKYSIVYVLWVVNVNSLISTFSQVVIVWYMQSIYASRGWLILLHILLHSLYRVFLGSISLIPHSVFLLYLFRVSVQIILQ